MHTVAESLPIGLPRTKSNNYNHVAFSTSLVAITFYIDVKLM